MDQIELEFKLQTVLFVVEALAYLALALWFATRGREGRWAAVGAVGAGLVGLAMGVIAAASFEAVFLESSNVAELFFDYDHLSTVLQVMRAIGALTLFAGIVESRRRTPVPAGSIYGP
jgi:zinc transporter ZupT